MDWAALAKQWIAQRETVNEPPPSIPMGGAPPPPPPPANGGAGGDDMELEGETENTSQDSSSYGNMPVYQNQGKFKMFQNLFVYVSKLKENLKVNFMLYLLK